MPPSWKRAQTQGCKGGSVLALTCNLQHNEKRRRKESKKEMIVFTSTAGEASCGAQVFEEFFGLENGAVKSDKKLNVENRVQEEKIRVFLRWSRPTDI